MHLRLPLAMLLSVGATVTTAQTMYRCGSTYSQTPCGTGQIEIKVKEIDPCSTDAHRFDMACISRRYEPSQAEKKLRDIETKAKQQREEANAELLKRINLSVPDTALVEENKKVCLANITAALKDPESARFGKVTRMGAELDTRYGISTPSIMYTTMVNAKNSYGGYTGSKVHLCVFSTDEKRFVRAWSPE